MIVVADTTPVNYLILIDAIGVLEPLYKAVVIPEMVFSELSQPGTPAEVRIWIENRPTWLDVAPDPPPLPELEALDPGERAAIALALALPASRLLIDDAAGRIEAERRRLKVTGTLGVLAAAHRSRLLDFDSAVERLLKTRFYVSPRTVAAARRLLGPNEGPVPGQ